MPVGRSLTCAITVAMQRHVADHCQAEPLSSPTPTENWVFARANTPTPPSRANNDCKCSYDTGPLQHWALLQPQELGETFH